jgi:hypothetical protein
MTRRRKIRRQRSAGFRSKKPRAGFCAELLALLQSCDVPASSIESNNPNLRGAMLVDRQLLGEIIRDLETVMRDAHKLPRLPFEDEFQYELRLISVLAPQIIPNFKRLLAEAEPYQEETPLQ